MCYYVHSFGYNRLSAISSSKYLHWQVADRLQQLPTPHQDHDLPGYDALVGEFQQPGLALSAGKHTDTAQPSGVQFLCSTPVGSVLSSGFTSHSTQNRPFQRHWVRLSLA